MDGQSQKTPPLETAHAYVYDRKFDIALRETTILAFRHRILTNQLRPSDHLILDRINGHDVEYTISEPHCYALLLQKILSPNCPPPPPKNSDMQWLQRAFKIAVDTTILQSSYMVSTSDLPSTSRSLTHLADHLSQIDIDPVLHALSVQVVVWTKIVEKLGKVTDPSLKSLPPDEYKQETKKQSEAKVPGVDWTVAWNGRLCLITTELGDQFLLPQAYILMIANKLCDILSVLLSCKVQSGVCYEANAYTLLISFVKVMAMYACRYKNKFFTLTASLEGIIVGMTLRHADDWENDTLYRTLAEEIHKTIKLDLNNCEMMTILRQCSIPLLHEFSCLSKIWGHPLVSMKKGAKKLHHRTTEQLEIDPAAVQFCANKAVESYVLNHLCRHGSWPLCDIERKLYGPDPLMQACLRNKSPFHPSITNKYGKITTEDWARVTCKKNMKFAEIENIIPLLKDKTISVLRSKVMVNFIKTRVMRSPRWEDTRLLLFYILNTVATLDHLKYLHRFVDVEDLEELSEYLVMRIVPKEKEHKVEFRGFGVKTYWDRFRSLIMEKNMAHFLDLYCDQQAMTLSELEISKKLYAFRTLERAFTNHTKLMISFDASGWNNRFRHETTAPVVRRTADLIFDYPIFSKMHEAYEKTFYYIPDEMSTHYWDGQLGGIEGLNQYTWDHIYLPQIDYAMVNINVKYFLLVKGDDLRMVALISPAMLDQHPLQHWKDTIVGEVSKAAKVFGHEIKIQESYGSATFLAFSKFCSIGTIELPQTFRKIQKVYGCNNAFIPTLDEYIGSTLSNAHAAAKVSSNPTSCYIVGIVWFFQYLIIHPLYKNLTDNEILSFSLIPSMVGGFPLIFLHNMFVRAESDLLSPFLHIIDFCQEHYPEIGRILNHFLKLRVPPKPDWVRLYTDPYSLNIVVPKLPSSVLRAHILPQLRRVVRNEDIQALIKATDSPFSNAIIKCLSDSSVQQVKAFSTIYSALPVGVLSELLRKFESGRSILELLLLRRPIKYSSQVFFRVQRAEHRLQSWRIQVIKNKHIGRYLLSGQISDCPAEKAQMLRDMSWGRIIEGITMPPLVHQVRLSTAFQSRYDPHAKQNHFTLYYKPPTEILHPDGPMHWASSGFTPFLGFTTRTGNVTPMMKLTDSDSFVLKLRNLLDLLSWVNITKVRSDGVVIQSNLPDLIGHVINTFSPVDTQDLAPFRALKKSGTQMHHMRSPGFRESIVPNILSNRYQMVEGKSDSHLTLRTSRFHYMVNFLHILCHSTTLATFELESMPTLHPPPEMWVVTTNCPYCTNPISETPIEVDLSNLPTSTPDLSKFQACRIDKISKQIILESYDVYKQREWRHVEEAVIPLDIAAQGVIQEFIAHTRRTHDRLEDRYTQHRLTRQGHRVLADIGMKTASRTVGSTELKLLPNDAIIHGLVIEVYRYCTDVLMQFSYDRIVTHFSSVPPSEFSWYQLVCKLADVNRLGGLVTEVFKKTKTAPPVCYSNPEAACRYLGMALSSPHILSRSEIRICKLTYQEDVEITELLKQAVRLVKYQYLIEEGVNAFRRWIQVRGAPAVGTRLMSRIMDIIQCEYDLDAMIDHIKGHNPEDGWFQLRPYMYAEGVFTMEFIEDMMPSEMSMIKWIKKEFPNYPWDNLLAIREEHRQDGDLGEEIIAHMTFRPPPVIFIAISDIAQCITSLRDQASTIEEENSSAEEEEPYPQWPTVSFIFNRSMLIRMQSGGMGRDDIPPPVINYDFSSNKLVFDTALVRRPYGPGTTSVNKLIEILNRSTLNMRRQYSMATIACLADGYGGFLNFFSELTYNCKFLYNTLPPDGAMTAYPELARASLEANRHTLNTHSMDTGYFDLRESYVLEEMELSEGPIDMITCDAEVIWSDFAAVESLWSNVLVFAHHKLILQGCLIMKVHLGTGRVCADIVEKALSLFDHVGLMRPLSSYFGGEIYMICYHRRLVESSYEERLPAASRAVVTKINRIITRRRQEHEGLLRNKNRTIPLHIAQTTRLSTNLRRCLGPNYLHKCIPVIGGSLPTINEEMYSRRKAKDILALYRPSLDALLQEQKRGAQDDVMIRHNLSCDLNTHSYHLKMWMTQLSIEGVLWALGEFWKDQPLLVEVKARTYFNLLWSRAPQRLQLPPLSPQVFRNDFQLLNNRYFCPYYHFLRGIKLACGMISYVRSRTKH
uniref:RNA-directed RNA polymerase n=1 Tax=Crocidura lasiura chuvirus TaxID=3139462 RepID=A0AB38ZJL6_9VIRU